MNGLLPCLRFFCGFTAEIYRRLQPEFRFLHLLLPRKYNRPMEQFKQNGTLADFTVIGQTDPGAPLRNAEMNRNDG